MSISKQISTLKVLSGAVISRNSRRYWSLIRTEEIPLLSPFSFSYYNELKENNSSIELAFTIAFTHFT